MTGAAPRQHGGPDRHGAARHDFSVCANPLGPCPTALAAIQAADTTRYPDPASTALREQLARRHAVSPERILIAASASEFIQRMTAAAVRLGLGPAGVEVPRHGYGDYVAAAAAWGLAVQRRDVGEPTGLANQSNRASQAGLRWWAEPASPLGDAAPPPADPGAIVTVLDAVYEPLRLQGETTWRAAERDAVYVLHGPNKALGLCGLRGAYAIAPAGNDARTLRWRAALDVLSPSWPLSAGAVAMLVAWARPETAAWLQDSLQVLRQWRADLERVLQGHRFELAASLTSFCCARVPDEVDATALAQALRRDGIAVRDATSFGLPGWWRLSVQPPEALLALDAALTRHLARPPGQA